MSLEPLGAHDTLRREVRALRAALDAMKAGVEIEKAAHAACCENRLEILAELTRVRAALDAYEGIYRRLGESSAYAKLDSDVWYAITKAHEQARAALEGRAT